MGHLYHWGKDVRENRKGALTEGVDVRSADRIGWEIGAAAVYWLTVICPTPPYFRMCGRERGYGRMFRMCGRERT